MHLLVDNNGCLLVVSDLLGRGEIIGLVNGTMVIARVVIAMVVVVFIVGDVIELVGVPIHAVEGVVVRVVEDICYLLCLVYLVQGHRVVLDDVVMHVLFVGFSDYCHRVVVVKKVAGLVRFVLPHYQRKVVLINERVVFCFIVGFKVVVH